MIFEKLDWGRKWLVDFTAVKTVLVSFDLPNNTGTIDVKMDGSVLEEKSSFEMPVLIIFSNLKWHSFLLKLLPRKLEP